LRNYTVYPGNKRLRAQYGIDFYFVGHKKEINKDGSITYIGNTPLAGGYTGIRCTKSSKNEISCNYFEDFGNKIGEKASALWFNQLAHEYEATLEPVQREERM
jgi:hypothetical protein